MLNQRELYIFLAFGKVVEPIQNSPEFMTHNYGNYKVPWLGFF